MRGYGSSSATPNARTRNIAVTNNSTGVISALTGAPQSAKFKSASMATNGSGPSAGAYDPVMGKKLLGYLTIRNYLALSWNFTQAIFTTFTSHRKKYQCKGRTHTHDNLNE